MHYSTNYHLTVDTIGILVDDDCTVPTFKRCPDIRLTIGSSAISFQIIAINNWCVWNMGLTNQQQQMWRRSTMWWEMRWRGIEYNTQQSKEVLEDMKDVVAADITINHRGTAYATTNVSMLGRSWITHWLWCGWRKQLWCKRKLGEKLADHQL